MTAWISLLGLLSQSRYHWLGSSNNRNVRKLEVHNQDVRRIGYFWGLSAWLVDACLFPVSSCGLSCVQIFSSCEEWRIGLGLILMPSFKLNYLFKSPLSKHSLIPWCWGLGFQPRILFNGTQYNMYLNYLKRVVVSSLNMNLFSSDF